MNVTAAGGDEAIGGRWLTLARPLPVDTQLLVARLASVLFLTSGTGGLVIAATAGNQMLHPLGLTIVSIIPQLTGVAILAASYAAPQVMTRWFPAFAYVAVLGSVVLVALAQYTTGPVFVVASIVHVEVTIFAFYLLPRARALGVLAFIGIVEAFVLSGSDYSVPLAQWSYLMGVLLAVGLTFRVLLIQRVDESVQLDRLRRFLAPQVADALLASGSDEALDPHRRQIAVLFCDLRGFTKFAAGAEPEDVVEVLDEYYGAAGERLRVATATVGAFAGDGLMAYFNDPVACDDPAARAIEVALEIQADLDKLRHDWERRGFSLGHGIGIAFGYATLGVVGFEGRSDYTPLGPVVNLASRLSDAAAHGEILVDPRAYAAAQGAWPAEGRQLLLKGLTEPVQTFVLHA